MTWGEAVRIVRILRTDPSSALSASLEGWAFSISRETLAMLDLFDLLHTVNAGKRRPKPHGGRPFRSDARNVERFGDTSGQDKAVTLARLRALGHAV